MPYNGYVCDQSPYSLSIRDYYTGPAPSSPDITRAETTQGIVQINRFNQTRFEPYKDSTGHYIDTWFEYIPQEVLEGKTADGSVPLVLVLHGSDDDMRAVVNQVGWLKLAGEKRFIIAAPDHQFLAFESERSEAFIRLIDYMTETYPSIDKSRIYVTGFSLGGVATINAFMYHPERYAAAAPMAGFAFISELTPEIRSIYAKHDLPIFYYTSTLDTLVAFANDGNLNSRQQTTLNLLMPLNEFAPLRYDFSAYPVFGFQGDINETYILNNEFRGGSFTFINRAGVPMFVYSYVEDIIHALWFRQAELAWDYMSRFSRDQETLKLNYR
jgi:alpha/beta superfamily hydrolase